MTARNTLPLGTSTMSYRYTHGGLEALMHLADLGFSLFELVVFPPHCWPRDLTKAQKREYAERIKARGITVHSLCYPIDDNNINSLVPEVRRYTIDTYKEIIDLAAEWKVPFVSVIAGRVHPYFAPPREQLVEHFADGTRELLAHAKGCGVSLCIENVQYTLLRNPKEVAEMIALIGDPALGATCDVPNAALAGDDPVQAIRDVRDVVKLVHLADANLQTTQKGPVGTGIIDFGRVAATLTEIGFKAPTMLEVITWKDTDEGMTGSMKKLAQWGWQSPAR